MELLQKLYLKIIFRTLLAILDSYMKLYFNYKITTLISILLLQSISSLSQLPYGLIDGQNSVYCETCNALISEMPAEVLFGIDIKEDGDVYFSMNNKEWFNKIITVSTNGISVDIVSKDRYDCNKETSTKLLRGFLLKPIYKSQLLSTMQELQPGNVYIKIGTLPPNLLHKEVEGNLVILNGNQICYYTNFVNINRDAWNLLPMGLFTDTLIQASSYSEDQKDFFTYNRKVQVTIPFLRGKAVYDINDIKPLYDSLHLIDFEIRKIEIRAYSSVEGTEKVNKTLMQDRANAMIKALQQFQPSLQRIKIITAENWLEFFQDIRGTKYEELSTLSKVEIKQKLSDKIKANELEPLLALHRKAIITVYLENKTTIAEITNNDIVSEFEKAVNNKKVTRARIIQKELVERIIDNKLPIEYIDQLEIPKTKDYFSLMNDREVYRYLLHTTSEYEALENFLEIKKLEPNNGQINYNICALRFFIWQYGGDSINTKSLYSDIYLLYKQTIDSSLVKRMLINYHILKCQEYLQQFKYTAKDEELKKIRDTYRELKLTDDEIFSLAKYLSFYSHKDWAEELVNPRISKVDVSEDLLFYYLNLEFYHPDKYSSDDFHEAVLNAINLNRQKFCTFFSSYNKGGASMQLLEYEDLKEFYCESCKIK